MRGLAQTTRSDSLCVQTEAPTDAQLHAFASQKWEQLLLFLVGAGEPLAPEYGST